jgi:hypothetical protein
MHVTSKSALLLKVFSNWMTSRYSKSALPMPFTYQIEVTENYDEYVDTNLSPPMLIMIVEGHQQYIEKHWLPFNFVGDMGPTFHESNGNRYRYQLIKN